MKEMVYTLATWRVQEGRQQAFISAWKNLGAAFNALSDPPGKGGNQKAREAMHGGHPGVVSRRRRIALTERTDKRISTR